MTAKAHRWEELAADSPMAMLTRRRVIGSQAMVSHVTLQRGCEVPVHAHANEQFVCVLSGRLRFHLPAWEGVAARDVEVGAGGVLHLPAHVPHGATALEDAVVLDVFSPPSAMTGIDRGRS